MLFNIIRKMFLLLLFNIALLKLSHSYEIKATGNGIIKPGTDLELSLEVNNVSGALVAYPPSESTNGC